MNIDPTKPDFAESKPLESLLDPIATAAFCQPTFELSTQAS